ncbi:MAG: TonB-dependent receptor [Bacteroidales bacterium]|nr:TonB-dependent receptor [Bacteroidales bacterium]
MKISVFLWILAVCNAFAIDSYSQSTELSLNLKSATIEQVLLEIEKNSEFYFLYNNKLIDVTRKVNANFKNEKIIDILDELFAEQDIEYIIKDKQIILSPNNYDLLYKNSSQQAAKVTGTVTGSDGSSLPGVNVVEKGTTNGTITDLDGKFTITVVSKDAVLLFSFIGYLTQEVTVGEQTTINVTMAEDLVGLEEVVVVGYGTVKKSDITGALTSVSSEQIAEMPVTNINQAIQGRAAGVDVVNTSYGLNSRPEIRIRGNRSIKASNDPLYVVDGVPISGSIQDFNPGDIESIEILKDASATAIYGSRAANGVILITTKRGKSGKFSVNVESSVTLNNPLRYFDKMTGDDWLEMARNNQRPRRYASPFPNPEEDYEIVGGWETAWQNVQKGYEWLAEPGANPNLWQYKKRAVTEDEKARWGQVIDVVPDSVPIYNPENVGSYDWYSEGLNKNALLQQYNISFSGGSEGITAYFSLGYINQEGLGVGENFQRISPRLNLDLQPAKWIKVGVSASFNSELTDPGEGLLSGVVYQIPITTPYDTAGVFQMLPTGNQNLKNPIRDEELNVQEDRVYRYMGSYYAEISFTNAFKYRVNVGQDFRHYSEGDYRDEMSSAIFPSTSWARWIQGQSYYYSVENLLYYNKEIGIHNIGLTFLQSFEVNKSDRMEAEAENLPYPSALWYWLRSVPTPGEDITYGAPSDPFRKTQLASFMGRVNYGLMDKYLLTASIRRDATSVFYVDNNYDYFPSFALAWKIHNESFMQNLDFLSQLKLRFGLGTVGQSATAPYETNGTVKETQYVFYDPSANDDVSAKGLAPDKLQTRIVGWEKTATINLGLDFGLFQNKIAGTVELYRANTHDLLLDKRIPAVNGTTSIRSNIGKTKNEGVEVTLNTFNMDRGNFRWETDFTFMANREEIVELADGVLEDIVNNWYVGEPIGSWRTYEFDGIWQIKDSALMNLYNTNGSNGFEVGRIRPKDVDGNDTINADDLTLTGNNVPKFSCGLTNYFSYKGFELSFFIFARVGHSIYSRDGHYFPMSVTGATPFKVNYYKPLATEEENADADHPAPTNGRDPYETAMYVREASFLKVRNITLSYNVPQRLLSRANIESLKFSVQLINPLLLTKYPYLDPEAQNSTIIRTPAGISSKGVTFGIKLAL